MKREEIIEMARETLLASWHKDLKKWQIEQGVEAFAKLIAAKEREACANAADEHMRECEGKSFGVGAAIRARGEA